MNLAPQPTTATDIWTQTMSGRAVPMLNPTPADIDLRNDVAPALGQLARFAGQIGSGPYSVAQHSVVTAQAAFRETGRHDLATAILLHDAHEPFTSEITYPAAEAIAQIARDMFGAAQAIAFRRSLAELKHRFDAAIHGAALFPYPLAPELATLVKRYDIRALKTERNQLMRRPPKRWNPAVEAAEPLRLIGGIKIWPWAAAAEMWLEALHRHWPQALH